MHCGFCDEEVTEGVLACPRCGGPISKQPGQSGVEAAPGPSSPAREGAPEEFTGLIDDRAVGVPPGATVAPEQVQFDQPGPTHGYQGPTGPSVAGAGEQTEDDPFGLNFREKESSTLPPLQPVRRYSGWRNIAAMIVTVIVMGAIVSGALYFGFLKKKNTDATAPLESVKDFYTYAVSDQYQNMTLVAVPNAPVVGQVQNLLVPYRNDGLVTLDKFGGKVVGLGSDRARVDMTELKIKVRRTENSEVYSRDLLEKGTQPYPMPSSVILIKQNGKWLINS